MNSGSEVKSDARRALPAVDHLLRQVKARAPEMPRWAAVEGARRALSEAREGLRNDAAPPPALAGLADRAVAVGSVLARPHPGRVVNATGIVLHTNLGRAPLAPAAAEAVARGAVGYGDLELDLTRGARGERTGPVCEKLRLLSGAPGALVVNNNAAAVMLVLATLARGREVIVSRGELVEIGGAFRVPEIMESAGAKLVEVGTTNRTHAADYERAIGPETGLLLKVHRSNFEVRGFVAEVELPELARIARGRGLPVVEDLGSGTLVDLTPRGLPAESLASARLQLGADMVCFSADKLLGGPQAGIVLGADAERIEAMRRHPLARALRLDKLSLAALDWTLGVYLDGRAEREIPVLRALLASPDVLEARARRLAARLSSVAPDARIEVEPDRTVAGGGSLPGFELDTWVVTVRAPGGAERCARRLRSADTPVLARIRDGAVVFDVRTLLEGEEKAIEAALAASLR
jgi:L-seryl-tRNA(Ser) seleniumtransferase